MNRCFYYDYAPCIRARMDDNNSFIMEPQVLTPKRTEYGKQVRKQYENKQINESRHNMNELTPRTDGMANTLSTVQKDNLLLEPQNVDADGNAKTITSGYYKYGTATLLGDTYGTNGTTIKEVEPTASVSPQRKLEFKGDKGFSNISPSLRSSDYKSPHVVKEPQLVNYRIRKLTPTECFRLMDVDDADIDKLLNSGISNSQLYKMAGNSIVVSCLFHIFRKMFVETHNESQQLTLF